MKSKNEITMALKGIETTLSLHEESQGSVSDVVKTEVLKAEINLLEWVLDKK